MCLIHHFYNVLTMLVNKFILLSCIIENKVD